MKTPNTKNQLLGIICVFAIFVISNGRSRTMNSNNQKIRAVNLGGWLVTEGWMKPSLFDSIPNKDFLDGAGLQFKSATIGKFLCAELGGGTIIVANRTSASGWETFRLWRIDETNFHLRVFNKEFLGLDSNGINLVAVSTNSETSGIFEIIKKSDDSSHVRIKAPNGLFLQAKTEDSVTADSNGDGQWRDDDPSVFEMTKVETMRGEYQVTNGYGPTKAPKIMKDHWDTFIVEADFKFIATSGLNAVRIPVGWWTASDPTPPKPYVGGSLHALDNAFLWAKKYNLKVILDLHAAPGSQNGYEHSSGRDGFIEWGLTDETIRQTVDVIEFFTARYAKNPSLYAVELINEPRAPGVPLSVLTKYYEAGYKVVRKHAPNAFVVLSNRLSGEPKELFPVASGMKHVVVDVHYYNLFSDIFNDMTVEQNIDFIQTNRSAELQAITTANGPRIFVGEWVAEWQVRGATKQDFQRFSEAQLEVWGRASFGWAYWSLKNVNNHWSMDWMIKNGYINL
ncbi:probable glucan 1,3-beta-glucosidase A [Cynara cardunculus var. scolymus]|uniref:probable glucan 1,3-beta-glucosidase A n=1 Tax=Cynara cardunculus var. scolymus TaxID=59895 RepID=UPI000D62520D|nr:probable glucan 1,3-beta-glucosidase A [Cynara cardunculus var. scolymus]